MFSRATSESRYRRLPHVSIEPRTRVDFVSDEQSSEMHLDSVALLLDHHLDFIEMLEGS